MFKDNLFTFSQLFIIDNSLLRISLIGTLVVVLTTISIFQHQENMEAAVDKGQ